MILSSDELEIIEYLKSHNGTFVSMVQICRTAGGRSKYSESPHWAKRLMSRLVDEQVVEVNERGHYRINPATLEGAAGEEPVIEDYFVKEQNPLIVGDDYFPAPEPEPVPVSVAKQFEELPAKAVAKPASAKSKRWVSPQMQNILEKAAKKSAKA
jgi:hypothetical protein